MTPSELPALDLLTTQELGALRSAFLKESQDARKRSNKLLVKTPSLSLLWTRSMSSNLTTEEKQFVNDSLHLALMKQPDAFIAYNHANTMARLAHVVWQELLLRGK